MRSSLKWYFSLSLSLFIALVCLALYPSPGLAKDDEDEDDKVHDLMEKVHEGKNSPWKKAANASAKNPVDWATIKSSLPRLETMSKALLTAKNKEVRDTADSYVVAIKDIANGLGKQDVAATRAAFTALSNSCADCHYKGGPGGKLD